MSYVLAPYETPGGGLARVIDEQVAKLSAECVDAREHVSSFAHKARVRAKRIRAALRLAKPLMSAKAYRRENRWWRDAARLLSDLRDAGARVEALESLQPFLIARIGTAMTRKLGERFEAERRPADAGEAIDAFRSALAERRSELVPQLERGDREALAEALGETYRAARRMMKASLEDEDPVLLHEWRKQAKYHALQARLLRLTFPEAMTERVGQTRVLPEVLGQVQDIEVVAEGAKEWESAPEGFLDVLNARRSALVFEAKGIGETVFALKPKAWMKALAGPSPVAETPA